MHGYRYVIDKQLAGFLGAFSGKVSGLNGFTYADDWSRHFTRLGRLEAPGNHRPRRIGLIQVREGISRLLPAQMYKRGTPRLIWPPYAFSVGGEDHPKKTIEGFLKQIQQEIDTRQNRTETPRKLSKKG